MKSDLDAIRDYKCDICHKKLLIIEIGLHYRTKHFDQVVSVSKEK